jgi:heme exporter protein D
MIGGMLVAAAICALLALAMLANIEVWRRRTVAEIEARDRRRRTREQAWEAVGLLERDAA